MSGIAGVAHRLVIVRRSGLTSVPDRRDRVRTAGVRFPWLVISQLRIKPQSPPSSALEGLATTDPNAEFVLVIPATPVKHLGSWTEGEARAAAGKKAANARERLEAAGINVVDSRVGDAHPYLATTDALTDGQFDAVIVSTFPRGISRWLRFDVIKRLERDIDLPITHVVAR